MWLAGNQNGSAFFVRAEGYDVAPIENPAVEHQIQSYGTVSDAVSFVYQGEGHPFLVTNFPSAGVTWAYDTRERLFHKRVYHNATTGMDEAYRPQYHSFCFGKHLVGDRDSYLVYEMRSDVSTEVDGEGIRRVRQCPVYAQSAARVFHQGLELEIEPGLGLNSGQGSDPQVALSWSNDGGKTWGNEHWKSAGAIGNYQTRIYWQMLGMSWGNRRVYKAVMTDPIPFRLSQAWLTMEGGQ
jgi:hypothetical protein